MRNTLLAVSLLVIGACTSTSTSNESAEESFASPERFIGAWEATIQTDSGSFNIVAIVTDGYFSTATFNEDKKVFVGAAGGSWKLDSGYFVETYEYFTTDTAKVGTANAQKFTFSGDSLTFADEILVWTRLDDGTPGELNGAWLITGRERDGEISRRTPGVRKTMKILSGTRFQWIAYNTETKQFHGTGGGTYTTADSTYTENIDFFSRDSSRVGASLEFTYALDSGEWHHSGLSSRGEPLYEIWTPRKWIDEAE